MAEAAGLVLGAIPLIFLALDKYQECLEFGKTYARYTDTLMSIRDEITLQQMQFHGTMEMMGLYKPTYMELEDCLRDRFPENHTTFMRYIRKMATITNQLMAKLEVDVYGKHSDIVLSRTGWEWRRVKRSLSTKERKKMFDELQHSNIILRTLLSKPEVPVEDWTPMVQALAARYNQNDCDAVRYQASDVKKALDACWQCSCSHQASLDLDWHTNRPTRSPVFSVTLSYSMMDNQQATGSPRWRKTQLKVETAGISSSAGSDEQVLGPPLTDIGLLAVPPAQSSATKQQTRSLLSQLRPRSRSTSPLPPSLSKSAATVSLAKSTKEINSLCRFIKGLDSGEETLLVQLLPPNKPPAHLRLSRRKRLEIASAAAWATLLLCDTPWLNHTWDKHGLRFFSENSSTAGLPFSGRCVSMTQGCASSPPLQNATDANLQHRIIRNEAIFALGILLIELGLNRSFEECKKSKNIDTATNVVDDYDVADGLIEEVFDEVGEPYGNAVQRCIRFAFPGRDTTKNFSHAAFRQYFHNLVVAPIEATLSTMPA